MNNEHEMIDIAINNEEVCKLQTGLNALIIYITTSNNSNKPSEIIFQESYILTKERRQIMQNVWLSSHFGSKGKILPLAKVESGLCFDNDQVKKLENGSQFYITYRNDDSEFKITNIFTKDANKWTLIDQQEEHDPKGGSERLFNKYLKNRIERFESMEEQSGIEIRNISLTKSSTNAYIGLTYEIVSIISGKIPNSLNIDCYAIDGDGAILDQSSGGQLSKSEFDGFRIDSRCFSGEDITSRIDKVRIIPRKIRMAGD